MTYIVHINIRSCSNSRELGSSRSTLRSCCGLLFVVSHIQRIGCQPERTTLHGSESRSRSAEQGKEKKIRKYGSFPPPPPMLLVRREYNKHISTWRVQRRGQKSRWRERASRDASTCCMPRCYAGFGPSRARTGFLRLVNYQ